MFVKAVLPLFVVFTYSGVVFTMSAGASTFPEPFTRELSLKHPLMEGSNDKDVAVVLEERTREANEESFVDVPPISPPCRTIGKDVTILQNLLLRSPYVEHLEKTSLYDEKTFEAVANYQKGNDLPRSGVFDVRTAFVVLQQLMYDKYKDDGTVRAGYKFKILVPVYKDRTKETIASLFDSNNMVRYTFVARCHGGMDKTTGEPLNQLTRNGNTPTGLVTFDLNSPEPDPKSYGPYPVIRAVKGLEGNAAIGRNKNDTFLSDYRSGILLHTGEWSKWNPSLPMPNSDGCIHVHPTDLDKIDQILVNELGVVNRTNPFGEKPYPYIPQGLFLGCIHAHPEDLKKIDEILKELGVVERPNTLGKLPYPYKPQGLLSVEQIDTVIN